MAIRNTDERFGWLSIGFHWLTVVLVVGMCLVGFLMQELPTGPFKIQVFALHKSTGLTVLALTGLRLLWRLIGGVPAPVPGTPRWQMLAAGGSHAALYAILLVMPLSGWLYNSASGYPLRWFGLFSLPRLVGRDAGIKEFAHEAHEWLFIALAVIVTVHALAALKHHYFDRDRTLVRMFPWTAAPSATAAVAAPAPSGKPADGESGD
jgi:cytochrome b561